MPLIKVGFKPLIYKDPISKELVIAYAPKIPIFIKVGGILYPFKIDAFVDSGATRNLFPAEVLQTIGAPLENDNKFIHLGIGGKELVSYAHEGEILIGNYKINTQIDFSVDHKAPLLGLHKFFDFFDSVNFNMERQILELSYSSKKN